MKVTGEAASVPEKSLLLFEALLSTTGIFLPCFLKSPPRISVL